MACEEIDSRPRCSECGGPFVPRTCRQVTCGAPRCRNARLYRQQRANPAHVAATRARCARWYAARHPGSPGNAWLAGAPVYGEHLPGGACALELRPAPRWPVELRNARALHGVLTTLLGKPHHPNASAFSLVPWERGWAVYWSDPDGCPLALREHPVHAFNAPRTLRLGPLARIRTPACPSRGRHRLRLDAITPVAMSREGHRVAVLRPTATSVLGSLAGVAARLGLDATALRLAVEDVDATDVHAVHVRVGGHWCRGGKPGTIAAWEGSLALTCNAPARWLLEAAARGPGLAGCASIGFGRVRVSEVDGG